MFGINLTDYDKKVYEEKLADFLEENPSVGKVIIEKALMAARARLAARKASRLSDTHWKLVYLLQNPEKTFEAFCIDKKGSDTIFLIPELDMQTVLKGCGETKLNDKVVLKALSVDVTTQNVDFTKVE